MLVSREKFRKSLEENADPYDQKTVDLAVEAFAPLYDVAEGKRVPFSNAVDKGKMSDALSSAFGTHVTSVSFLSVRAPVPEVRLPADWDWLMEHDGSREFERIIDNAVCGTDECSFVRRMLNRYENHLGVVTPVGSRHSGRQRGTTLGAYSAELLYRSAEFARMIEAFSVRCDDGIGKMCWSPRVWRALTILPAFTHGFALVGNEEAVAALSRLMALLPDAVPLRVFSQEQTSWLVLAK